MSDKFNEARVRFLRTLEKAPLGARRRDLPPASRQNDLVRQSLRKQGLAVFEERNNLIGKRWHITDEGRRYLEGCA